jgi:hypothetical protein
MIATTEHDGCPIERRHLRVFNPLFISFSRYDSLIGGFMALRSSLNRALEHERIRRGENLDF